MLCDRIVCLSPICLSLLRVFFLSFYDIMPAALRRTHDDPLVGVRTDGAVRTCCELPKDACFQLRGDMRRSVCFEALHDILRAKKGDGETESEKGRERESGTAREGRERENSEKDGKRERENER